MFRREYPTTVPIANFFIQPISPGTQDVSIKIDLLQPVKNRDGTLIRQVLLRCSGKSLNLTPYRGEAVNWSWKPHTQMKDYEIIIEGGSRKVSVVEQGEGIGVVILEPLGVYIKLSQDKTTDVTVLPVVFQAWRHDLECRTILGNDLSLGYHVLLYDGKTFHDLKE